MTNNAVRSTYRLFFKRKIPLKIPYRTVILITKIKKALLKERFDILQLNFQQSIQKVGMGVSVGNGVSVGSGVIGVIVGGIGVILGVDVFVGISVFVGSDVLVAD